MQASDVMTSGVLTIRPDASIREAVRVMLQHGISGLPVVDDQGALVGIVSEGDFLRRTETATERRRPRWLEILLPPAKLASEYLHSHSRRVEEVMTRDVVAVAPATPLETIVQLMEKHRIKRVPVVNGGCLVGIVTRANLLHALAAVSAKAGPQLTGDMVIRGRILAEMDKELWAPRALVNVVVWDGVVHLWGTIQDEAQRQGLRVLAENTPGVKGVRDHLVQEEPQPIALL